MPAFAYPGSPVLPQPLPQPYPAQEPLPAETTTCLTVPPGVADASPLPRHGFLRRNSFQKPAEKGSGKAKSPSTVQPPFNISKMPRPDTDRDAKKHFRR
jgi:hypothetical protein